MIPIQQFFNYAAVVATVDGSFACIIFELANAEEIIAYAGHFITDKDFIFDPNTREPVASDFSLLDAAKCSYLFLQFIVHGCIGIILFFL